jgi:hypothetical protein
MGKFLYIGVVLSSVVEQGTHKPLVGSPNLPLGTLTRRQAGFFLA